jgi:hypothetical protein
MLHPDLTSLTYDRHITSPRWERPTRDPTHPCGIVGGWRWDYALQSRDCYVDCSVCNFRGTNVVGASYVKNRNPACSARLHRLKQCVLREFPSVSNPAAFAIH